MATFDFESHKRNVERQAAQTRRPVDELFRNGKPTFTPEIHQEQMGRVLAPLRETVAAAHELASQAEIEARRLRAMQFRDPLQLMSTEDLQRMAALKPFVTEDIEKMQFEDLAARLRAVAHHGDVAHKYLYLRYAPQREDVRTTKALRSTLASLEESFADKEAVKAVEKATEIVNGAFELSQYAAQTLSEIDGSAAQALEQRRAEYGVM